jgi:prepilin-type N-terminal cleavage/methylation domain-containing protein
LDFGFWILDSILDCQLNFGSTMSEFSPNDFRTSKRPQGRAPVAGGFTLIELLVVISIIAVLAGLIAGLAPKIFDARNRNRVIAEREAIVTMIESYHAKMGSYPPSNTTPGGEKRPQLYYELTGTVTEGGNFKALDASVLTPAQILSAFGVMGFLNTGPTRAEVQNFYPSMPNSMSKTDGTPPLRFLVVPVKGPEGTYNTWRYDAHSDDRHNTESFDLWAEIILGGKTNTIDNWSK